MKVKNHAKRALVKTWALFLMRLSGYQNLDRIFIGVNLPMNLILFMVNKIEPVEVDEDVDRVTEVPVSAVRLASHHELVADDVPNANDALNLDRFSLESVLEFLRGAEVSARSIEFLKSEVDRHPSGDAKIVAFVKEGHSATVQNLKVMSHFSALGVANKGVLGGYGVCKENGVLVGTVYIFERFRNQSAKSLLYWGPAK